MSQSTATPTDPQIAHIAYTAGQIDIAAAYLALKKTHNKAVKTFAEEMVRDHTAVNKKALALLDKLKVKPEDNDTSKSLAGAAAEKRQELSKLSGAAFDKAYAENEVAYHQTVNGALETTLIPSTQNGELKSLLNPVSSSSRSIKSMPSSSIERHGGSAGVLLASVCIVLAERRAASLCSRN
jgi:putative membrane protein